MRMCGADCIVCCTCTMYRDSGRLSIPPRFRYLRRRHELVHRHPPLLYSRVPCAKLASRESSPMRKKLRSALHASRTLSVAVCCFFAFIAAQAPAHPPAQKAATANGAASSLSSDPRALLTQLNSLRVDPAQVYEVNGLNLRRDVMHLSFAEGKLAFFAPLGGRITGAVFSGTGHVIAIPAGAGERRSVARYLGVPILDLSFSPAYLRFDDSSAAELQEQLRKSGAKPASDLDFANSWTSVLENLNPAQSLRIMMDWLSAEPVPFFYAGLLNASTGPFELLLDGRRSEQVLMGQNRLGKGGYYYDVWASFAAHEPAGADASDASLRAATEPFVPLDYRVDSTIAPDLSLEGSTDLHLRAAKGGERMLALELSGHLAVENVALDGGPPLAFFQNEELSRRASLDRGNDALWVVLPQPAKPGQELHLRVAYYGNVIFDAGNGVQYVGERGAWYAHVVGHDFVPFDLSFRWPRRYTVVATGGRIESGVQGDVESGRWRSDVPFAVAGFNLGEYKTEQAGGGEPAVRLYANSQLEEAILARLGPRSNPVAVLRPPRIRRR